jgi:hypothetical protein
MFSLGVLVVKIFVDLDRRLPLRYGYNEDNGANRANVLVIVPVDAVQSRHAVRRYPPAVGGEYTR